MAPATTSSLITLIALVVTSTFQVGNAASPPWDAPTPQCPFSPTSTGLTGYYGYTPGNSSQLVSQSNGVLVSVDPYLQINGSQAVFWSNVYGPGSGSNGVPVCQCNKEPFTCPKLETTTLTAGGCNNIPGTSIFQYWYAAFVGTITPTVTGTYQFSISADDGASVWVDGIQVINQQGTGTVMQYPSSCGKDNVALTAGQPYCVFISYYNKGGASGLALFWQTTDAAVTNSLVPTSVFSPCSVSGSAVCGAQQQPITDECSGSIEQGKIRIDFYDSNGVYHSTKFGSYGIFFNVSSINYFAPELANGNYKAIFSGFLTTNSALLGSPSINNTNTVLLNNMYNFLVTVQNAQADFFISQIPILSATSTGAIVTQTTSKPMALTQTTSNNGYYFVLVFNKNQVGDPYLDLQWQPATSTQSVGSYPSSLKCGSAAGTTNAFLSSSILAVPGDAFVGCDNPALTSTATATRSYTQSATASSTNSATESATYSATHSATASFTESATASYSKSATASYTESVTASATHSATASFTESATASYTESATESATASSTQSATESATASFTMSATESFTESATATSTPTPTCQGAIVTNAYPSPVEFAQTITVTVQDPLPASATLECVFDGGFLGVHKTDAYLDADDNTTVTCDATYGIYGTAVLSISLDGVSPTCQSFNISIVGPFGLFVYTGDLLDSIVDGTTNSDVKNCLVYSSGTGALTGYLATTDDNVDYCCTRIGVTSGNDCTLSSCATPTLATAAILGPSYCYANCFALFKGPGPVKRTPESPSDAIVASQEQYISTQQPASPTVPAATNSTSDSSVPNCYIETSLLELFAGFYVTDLTDENSYCCVVRGWYVSATGSCYTGCPNAALSVLHTTNFYVDYSDFSGYGGNNVCYYRCLVPDDE